MNAYRRQSPCTASSPLPVPHLPTPDSPCTSQLRSIHNLALLAVAACLVTACGQPGAPQPPSLNLPVVVHDLSATRTRNTVHLEWTSTDRTTDRTTPSGPVRSRICRIEGTGPCETVNEQPATLGKAATWDDALTTDKLEGPPQLLTYYVELENHAHKSAGRSNPAYAASGPAPPPVDAPQALVQTGGVELAWQPAPWPVPSDTRRLIRIVRTLQAAVPAKSQQPKAAPSSRLVQARTTESPIQTLEVAVPDNPSAAEAARALDQSAHFDESYNYQLQRVETLKLDSHAVEVLGPETVPVSITVRDIFPPAIPQQLAAVADAASHAIDLSWTPDSEPDLAGYFVYRSQQQGTPPGTIGQRISGTLPLAVPSFHDTTVQPGIRYTYHVTAVDRNGNESKPSDEAEESLAPSSP